MSKRNIKVNTKDNYIKLCAKFYKCSSCPRNRICEEELKGRKRVKNDIQNIYYNNNHAISYLS